MINIIIEKENKSKKQMFLELNDDDKITIISEPYKLKKSVLGKKLKKDIEQLISKYNQEEDV